MQRPTEIIRASEIGRYAYCARAWWLGSVEGLPSSNVREMSAGEAAHHRHGTQVRASVLLARLAYLLLTLAVLIAVVLLMRGGGG